MLVNPFLDTTPPKKIDGEASCYRRKAMLSIWVVTLTGLVSLGTFSTALDPALEGTWKDWKVTHIKEYAEEDEEAFRRGVWEENLRMIEEHNRQADLGKHTYWLGMNHLSDLTNEEINEKLNGFRSDLFDPKKYNTVTFKSSKTLQVPNEIDWRAKGYVTEVKDQGSCGSCWSFSATGALEALNFKKTGKLVSLSEQNLIDCSKDMGNGGCEGGLMDQAFAYVQKQGGIDSEESYPYDGQDYYGCRYDPENSVTKCRGVGMIMPGDEESLQQAVATVGPIPVAVDAQSSQFKFYKSGIFKQPWQGEPHLTHAVLIVGYGTSGGGDNDNSTYWIIKNSWSPSWGDKGYMLMEKGSNQCGIADMACFPLS